LIIIVRLWCLFENIIIMIAKNLCNVLTVSSIILLDFINYKLHHNRIEKLFEFDKFEEVYFMESLKKFMFKKMFCIPVIKSNARLAFGNKYWVKPIDLIFLILFIIFIYCFVTSYSL